MSHVGYFKKIFVFTLFCSLGSLHGSDSPVKRFSALPGPEYSDMLDYFDAALKFPEFIFEVTRYRAFANAYFKEWGNYYPPALVTADSFLTAIDRVIASYNAVHSKPSDWLNAERVDFEREENREIYYSPEKEGMVTNGYIQKITLPPGAEVIFFGDLHGSLQAFIRTLSKLMAEEYLDNNLKLKPNTYMIFLGDFVDYGRYGADTLFTALHLRATNPDNVFLCRGNHEEFSMNEKNMFDFAGEIRTRYASPASSETVEKDESDVDDSEAVAAQATSTTLLNQIYKLYKHLPYAIFVSIEGNAGAGFAQCCHGGLDPALENGFLKTSFLPDPKVKFARLPATTFQNPVDSNDFTGSCNLNWGDFSGELNPEGKKTSVRGEGIWAYSINGAKNYMEKLNIQAIFRGHQDNFNAFKMLIRNISNPLYIFSQRPAVLNELYDLAPSEENAELLVYNEGLILKTFKTIVDSPASLQTHGFTLANLSNLSTIVLGEKVSDWVIAPIFTFSNAQATRGNEDCGYGILSLGETWATSRLRVHLFTNDFMQNRYRISNMGEIRADVLEYLQDHEMQVVHISAYPNEGALPYEQGMPIEAFACLSMFPFSTHIAVDGSSTTYPISEATYPGYPALTINYIDQLKDEKKSLEGPIQKVLSNILPLDAGFHPSFMERIRSRSSKPPSPTSSGRSSTDLSDEDKLASSTTPPGISGVTVQVAKIDVPKTKNIFQKIFAKITNLFAKESTVRA